MAEQNRTTLKTYLEQGDLPTEAQMSDLVDSVPNFADDFPDKYVKVEVSEAEIKALNTTPKELVAAPGAGKLLASTYVIIYYNYGTSQYLTNTSGVINNGTSLTNQTNAKNIIFGTSNYYVRLVISDFAYAENESLVLQIVSGNPTGGDGTLTVHLWYKEITL